MTLSKDYPILEFDSTKDAVIEPHKLLSPIEIPEKCVITFFKDVIERLNDVNKLKLITNLSSEVNNVRKNIG